MARRGDIGRPPRVRLSTAVDRAIDPIQDALRSTMDAAEDAQPRPSAGRIITFTSGASNRVDAAADTWTLVNPNASIFITPPTSPDQGDTFGVRNASSLANALAVDPVGDRLEDPTRPGTFVTSSLSIGGSIDGARWAWLGVGPEQGWWLVERIDGGRPTRTVSASTTLTRRDAGVVVMTASAGALTVTLPVASTMPADVIILRSSSPSAHVITSSQDAGNAIFGGSPGVLNCTGSNASSVTFPSVEGSTLGLMSTGAGWMILAASGSMVLSKGV